MELTPLDHEAEGQDDKQAMPIRRRAEPFEPGGALGVGPLRLERVFDLGHFEADQGGGLVAFGVVFGQNGACLARAAVPSEPARRLWCEEGDHDDLEDGRSGLQDRGETPAPGTVGEASCRAVGDPSGHDLAQGARRVHDRGNFRTLGRVCQLRNQDGTCALLDIIPKAEHHSPKDERGNILRGSLQRHTAQYNHRADDDGPPPTKPVDERRDDDQGCDLADAGSVCDKAQMTTLGMVEVVLPWIDRLKSVEHAAIIAVGDIADQCAEQAQVQLKEARVKDPELFALWQDVAEHNASYALGLFSVCYSKQHGGDGEARDEGQKGVRECSHTSRDATVTGSPPLLEYFSSLSRIRCLSTSMDRVKETPRGIVKPAGKK